MLTLLVWPQSTVFIVMRRSVKVDTSRLASLYSYLDMRRSVKVDTSRFASVYSYLDMKRIVKFKHFLLWPQITVFLLCVDQCHDSK